MSDTSKNRISEPPTSTPISKIDYSQLEQQLTPLKSRSMQVVMEIPSCLISIADLQRLYVVLKSKSDEAMEKYLDISKIKDPQIAEDLKVVFAKARDAGQLTIIVQGEDGERYVDTDVDILELKNLPDKLKSITLDSSIGLTVNNLSPNESFKLFLDFSSPTLLSGYDPFSESTPNSSSVVISGNDKTWVTAVSSEISKFFENKKQSRRFLHSILSFSLLSWVVGIPASLWISIRVDSWLSPVIKNSAEGIQSAIGIYIFLVTFLIFRGLIFILRSVYPVIELDEVNTRKGRTLIGLIATSLLLSLIYDVVKSLLMQ